MQAGQVGGEEVQSGQVSFGASPQFPHYLKSRRCVDCERVIPRSPPPSPSPSSLPLSDISRKNPQKVSS